MYSGKVRCIKSDESLFMLGEIYELENGKFIKGKLVDDEEDEVDVTNEIHSTFDNIEELNQYYYSQFEEVKDDKIKL